MKTLIPILRALGQMDLQDWLLVLGVLFWEAAALVLWWPSALILAGAFCFGSLYLIERVKAKTAKPDTKKPNGPAQ